MIRIIRFLALAAVLALAAGAALAAEPIKIGLILPLTGGSAAYGEMSLMGIRLAQAQRDQVLGRPVELVLVDNKSDKVESSNGVNRLIQRDQVVAILGPLSSSEALAAAPVAEAAKVPLVTAWATNPLVTQKRHYVFRTCFSDPFQGGVAANFAIKNLGAKTAALLLDVGRDYSVGLASFFKKSFAELGGRIPLTVNYSQGDQDFSAQLLAIKAKNPDVIYLPGYLPEEPLILRQARELGLKAPFLSGDAAQSDELIKIGGAAVEGLYFTTHFDEGGATTSQGREYAVAYRQKYGKAPDALGALGHDGYLILLAAIERAGSTQPEALVTALESTKGFAGVCGLTDIKGRDAVKPAVILQVKDGKFAFVASVKP
ncbi:MAG: ABC transporter substrate-binding protein [Pseudomonadota bacterium]